MWCSIPDSQHSSRCSAASLNLSTPLECGAASLNLSAPLEQVGRKEVLGHSRLHRDFQVSLGYISPHFKTRKTEKRAHGKACSFYTVTLEKGLATEHKVPAKLQEPSPNDLTLQSINVPKFHLKAQTTVHHILLTSP